MDYFKHLAEHFEMKQIHSCETEKDIKHFKVLLAGNFNYWTEATSTEVNARLLCYGTCIMKQVSHTHTPHWNWGISCSVGFSQVCETSFSVRHWSQDVSMEALVWMHVSSSFIFLLNPNILNERLPHFILFTVQRFYDRWLAI